MKRWMLLLLSVVYAPVAFSQENLPVAGVEELVGAGWLWVILVSLAGLGALFCFFGWRFLRPVLALAGFLFGVGGMLFARGIDSLEVTDVFVALGAGLALAVIFFFGYVLVVFLLGFQLGAVCGVLAVAGLEAVVGRALGSGAMILTLGMGLVGAVLALKWRRGIMILWTAFDGAALLVVAGGVGVSMVRGVPLVLQDIDVSALTYAAMLVLGVCGAAFQFKQEANASVHG